MFIALRIAVILSSILVGAILSGCAPPSPYSLGWARRGEFYFHGESGDRVLLDYGRTPGGEDYVYLFNPDGRRDRTLILPRGDAGRAVLWLWGGCGTYRVSIGPGHRYRLSTPHAALVFAPETLFPCLFQRQGEGGPYFFPVERGARFTLHATNQNDFEGSPARVTLRDPDGGTTADMAFNLLTEELLWERLGASPEQAAVYRTRPDTARAPHFRLLAESLAVAGAAGGFWRLDAGAEGEKADDVGFWLGEIPNLVAPSPEAWFLPSPEPVPVVIEADARRKIGTTGDLGVVWGWPSFHEEAREVFLDLGLAADKHFLPQVRLEPENDDADPLHARPEGFLFDSFAHRMGPPTDPALSLTSLMPLTRPAPWSAGEAEEFAEFAEAAIAYHTALSGVDPGRLYWQILHEPNHKMERQAYVDFYRVVAERLRTSVTPGVRGARLGGPALGQAAQEPGALDLSWIEELLRQADPLVDFVVWNQYRLPRLEDTWRYGELVQRTRELSRELDQDGELEEIVIGATNMKGGIVLHHERQDGFYGALWWASVVVNSFGTGDVRILNYFYLIDQGSRRKGLLSADGSWKPVARMTSFITRHLGDHVLEAETDHSEVEVLATSAGEDELRLLVVNKMRRSVDLSPLRVRVPAGWGSRLRATLVAYSEEDDEPRHLISRLARARRGVWEIDRRLAPRSVLGISVRPVSREL